MPRDGSGVASPVAGANTASSGTVIQSTLNNSNINDIYQLFNTAWPVSLGGTGGTTLISSWDSIAAAEDTVASAATLVLTGLTKPFFNISGTTGVTAITQTANTVRIGRIASAGLKFTASATLIVNGSSSGSYTSTANDVVMFEGYAASTVRIWVLSQTGLIVGPDVATAGTLDLTVSAHGIVNLTGTTTVTAVTLADGRSKIARAVGAFQMTASASLIVNGQTATNYTTVAGDLLLFEGYASSIVRVWLLSAGSGVTGTGAVVHASGPALTAPTVATSLNPASDNTVPLGTGLLQYSGLSLASGALIGWGAAGSTIQGSGGGNIVVSPAANFAVKAALDLSVSGGSSYGQIIFPASQNASANANTLDDYAEGTWTPTILFGGASVGITYGTQSGTYTKLGRLVTIGCSITLTSKGSSTGAPTISGAPFTSASSNVSTAAGHALSLTGLTIGGYIALLQGSSTSIGLRQNATTGTAAMADTNFTNTTTIQFSFSYYV